MTHRFATAADLPLLARWNRALIRDEGADNPMDGAALAERMRGFLERGYRAVVFEQAGAECAYLLYRPSEAGVHLRQLYVVPEHRRRGVGRAAVQALVEEILDPGTIVDVEVLVHNRAAWAFWRALGFEDRVVALRRVVSSPS